MMKPVETLGKKPPESRHLPIFIPQQLSGESRPVCVAVPLVPHCSRHVGKGLYWASRAPCERRCGKTSPFRCAPASRPRGRSRGAAVTHSSG